MIKLFTGKAMAASRGNAHPERLREALLEVLEEVAPGVTDQ
jgi:Asp-tRNA(Asn)/Glu-tRNA(Gln) amidotransferase B subunit